jgi:hypothetical protein
VVAVQVEVGDEAVLAVRRDVHGRGEEAERDAAEHLVVGGDSFQSEPNGVPCPSVT